MMQFFNQAILEIMKWSELEKKAKKNGWYLLRNRKVFNDKN